jgi:hypothetical protein
LLLLLLLFFCALAAAAHIRTQRVVVVRLDKETAALSRR